MRFDVLTLFPDLFSGYLGESLVKKAIQRNLIDVQMHDFRNWTTDKHKKVDDRPYGGGPGMVIMADPVVRCFEDLQNEGPPNHLLLCGRYEGFDQRVVDVLEPEEVSLGDFVLNGGEVAAMAIIDAVMRLIPGTLGDEKSHIDDSFSSGNRGLEYPHYTRPAEYRGLRVPEILLSGNHDRIHQWREEQGKKRTQERRKDLMDHEDSSDLDPNG